MQTKQINETTIFVCSNLKVLGVNKNFVTLRLFTIAITEARR